MKEAYILDGARTAFGGFGKSFKETSATQLGIASANEALKRAGVEPAEVEQAIYGNVIHSSVSAAYVARHVALHAGVPETAPAMLVNRLCASGMQAVVSAAQSIRLGEADLVLAGGIENMSQSPHVDFASRFGSKLGPVVLEDMLQQTLHDAYIGCGMGVTAENLAERYGFSREQQDEYAVVSHLRAASAEQSGILAEEIVGIEVRDGKSVRIADRDEQIRADTNAESLGRLKPAFRQGGTVTPGNASGINDGAVSLVIAGEDGLRGRQPLARIVSWGIAGVDPSIMGIGPVPASRIALGRAGLAMADMGLVEINEAFAVQYLAVERELQLDRAVTNVNGGAIALGHPVGASGARVLLTLAYGLRRTGRRYGLASLCIGGGQGMAVVLENAGI